MRTFVLTIEEEQRMIGSLASMVVLVAHGNATLKSVYRASDLDQHPVFKFYEWIRFRRVEKDVLFAGSPDEYLQSLQARGVRGLVLTYGSYGNAPEGISERMSAGFVGGGKQYLIQEFTDEFVNYLALQSELGDRERADQRIWRDTFQLYSSIPRQIVRPDRPDLEHTTKRLAKALQAAVDFCERGEDWLKNSNWPEVFKRALSVLDDKASPDDNHYLSLPAHVMSVAESRLLQAADRAWVFGGMGSWNDLGFSDDKLTSEYDAISNELYKAVNIAISDAVNASSPVFDLKPLTKPIPQPNGTKHWWKFW
jgi:hypothetical protein